MRVVCPGCAIVYQPPVEYLTPGRRLRCARCGETWALPEDEPHATAPEPHHEPAPAPAIEPDEKPAEAPAFGTAPSSPAAIAARRIGVSRAVPALTDARMAAYSEAPEPTSRASAAVLAGWLVTCLVLAGLGWGAYTYRGEVMAAWPPSTRVYAGLGLMK